MKIKVRKFREEDAREASRILTAAFKSFLGEKFDSTNRKHCSPAALKKKHRSKNSFSESVSYVATLDGAVAGYITGTANRSGFGSLEVIAVDPECFGENIGGSLFEKLEKFWMGKNLRKAETCVSAHNKRAVAFYLNKGFIPVGYKKDHFKEGIDEILLDKFLK